jgi:hypothetical protein
MNLVEIESVEFLYETVVEEGFVEHHVGLHQGQFAGGFEIVLVDVMVDDMMLDAVKIFIWRQFVINVHSSVPESAPQGQSH